MYPDRGDISAPLDADVSISKDSQRAAVKRGKETPLLRLRNGALQAGLNERLHRVVSMRKVRRFVRYFNFRNKRIRISMEERCTFEDINPLVRDANCVRFFYFSEQYPTLGFSPLSWVRLQSSHTHLSMRAF